MGSLKYLRTMFFALLATLVAIGGSAAPALADNDGGAVAAVGAVAVATDECAAAAVGAAAAAGGAAAAVGAVAVACGD
jgi:hypothetical protein